MLALGHFWFWVMISVASTSNLVLSLLMNPLWVAARILCGILLRRSTVTDKNDFIIYMPLCLYLTLNFLYCSYLNLIEPCSSEKQVHFLFFVILFSFLNAISCWNRNEDNKKSWILLLLISLTVDCHHFVSPFLFDFNLITVWYHENLARKWSTFVF